MIRELKCPYGDDFEGGDECNRCDKYEICMETPTADVVERSKIDNALADMQSMLDQERLNDNVISDVGQGIEIAMGLLNENIGE